jgi:hypothetical protein
MEGSMIFCKKNILEHSLGFFGEDYILYKEMPTKMRVSQTLSLTRLIPEK